MGRSFRPRSLPPCSSPQKITPNTSPYLSFGGLARPTCPGSLGEAEGADGSPDSAPGSRRPGRTSRRRAPPTRSGPGGVQGDRVRGARENESPLRIQVRTDSWGHLQQFKHSFEAKRIVFYPLFHQVSSVFQPTTVLDLPRDLCAAETHGQHWPKKCSHVGTDIAVDSVSLFRPTLVGRSPSPLKVKTEVLKGGSHGPKPVG